MHHEIVESFGRPVEQRKGNEQGVLASNECVGCVGRHGNRMLARSDESRLLVRKQDRQIDVRAGWLRILPINGCNHLCSKARVKKTVVTKQKLSTGYSSDVYPKEQYKV